MLVITRLNDVNEKNYCEGTQFIEDFECELVKNWAKEWKIVARLKGIDNNEWNQLETKILSIFDSLKKRDQKVSINKEFAKNFEVQQII